MSEIEQKIFLYCDSFLPKKVKKEFLYRWAKEPKITMDKFLLSIKKEQNRNWWIDMDSMFKSYDNYILGCVGERYPSLSRSPSYVLEEILNEADKMIKF